jgi:hypothetical protein
VLFGLGLTACSIAQIPSPRKQLHRLKDSTWEEVTIVEPEPLAVPEDVTTRRFLISVADGPRRFVVRRGAPVALLATLGHRWADAWGIRDVTPYTGYDSILTAEQLERTLDVLRDEGGNTLLTQRTDNLDFDRILVRRGFRVLTPHGLRTPRFRDAHDYSAVTELGPTTVERWVKWVDARHLHPRALQ